MKLRIFTKKTEQAKRKTLRNKMPRAEVLLWIELKNKKLGVRFLRQYSVGPFVLDFYSPTIKLALEVDGATHITDEEIEYDYLRQEEIEKNKIQFLRFTNPEIYHDMENVLTKIRAKIEEIRSA